MENHPIPQDVTGFQFKLIGSMTVKQFGYVAAGVIPAIIMYYAPLFLPIKLIFIPLLPSIGLAMAFLPVEGRPMDVMITNFIKAIFTPNQYVYQKMGRQLAFAHLSIHAPQKKDRSASVSAQLTKQQKLESYLQTTHGQVQSALDQKEAAYLQGLLNPNSQPSPQTTPTASLTVPQTPSPVPTTASDVTAPLPETTPAVSSPDVAAHSAATSAPSVAATPATAPIMPLQAPPISAPVATISNAENLAFMHPKTDIAPVQQQEAPIIAVPDQPVTETPAAPEPEQQSDVVKKQLEDIAAQKAQLEKELAELKSQLSGQQAPPQPGVEPQNQQPTDAVPQTEHVRKVPQTLAKSVGVAITPPDVPNLITGIVKDPRGNVLGNILVEIKDKEDNPVRAFKTNPLGQFASATQLPDGVFTIEFEDPKGQNRFDTIEMTMNGSIILPLEIISHDDREELRKALFN